MQLLLQIRKIENEKNQKVMLYVARQTRITLVCSQDGCFFLNGGAVTWKSSKQKKVPNSTCEIEYIAASEVAKEIWSKNFIADLGVVPSIKEPMDIFCDNEGAVVLTKEPKEYGNSRHILRKYHYV